MNTLSGKTTDRGFDNLLRSHIRRTGLSEAVCPRFDPDLAAAYVEHALTAPERKRFELHISNCHACRVAIVALARAVETDSLQSSVTGERRTDLRARSSFLESIRAGFSVVGSPRWAAVAVALGVVAVTVPLLVFRGGLRASNHQLSADARVTAPEPLPAIESQNAERDAAKATAAGSSAVSASPPRASRERSTAPVARPVLLKDDATNADEAPSSITVADARNSKKVEPGNAGAEEGRVKEPEEKPQPAAPGTVAQQRLDDTARSQERISKDDVLRIPPEEGRAATVTKLKPGVVDLTRKTEPDRVATITPKDGEAPATKGSDGDTRGTLSRRAGSGTSAGRALVDSETARARLPQRKLGKKTFWLSKGVWTDADYNPSDSLPIVTVVKDSDVYREMLEKNNKLRTFLTGFPGSERAIIVFKGMAYKLVPQSDSR